MLVLNVRFYIILSARMIANPSFLLKVVFLSDTTQLSLVRSMGLALCPYFIPKGFADLTDVNLADEDTNSILIKSIEQSKATIWQCKWRHLVTKFITNGSGDIW